MRRKKARSAAESKTNCAESEGKTLLSRRRFLALGGTALAAGFMPVFTARADIGAGGNSIRDAIEADAAADAHMPAGGDASVVQPDADFHKISQFLTGKELSPQQTQRTWQVLAQHDPAFLAKYQALRAFITASAAANIDVLKNHVNFTAELRQTALAVISAYYLGYVGTPKAMSAHDDTVFITYTQALMYRLAYSDVPIPTYSRWQPDFWGNSENPV